MTKTDRLRFLWLLPILMFYSIGISKAEDEVPCIRISGSSDPYFLDLKAYNRIYLNDDGFTFQSTSNEHSQEINLLYSLYNRIEFCNGIPTNDVNEINCEQNSFLRFSQMDRKLELITSSEESFTLGIFRPDGTLIAISQLKNAESISLEKLSSDVYVAVASDGLQKLSLKFIIK